MKQTKMNKFDIHSSQIEAGVNACVHILEQTLRLNPQQMYFVLQQALNFVGQEHNIVLATPGTNVETGEILKPRLRGPE